MSNDDLEMIFSRTRDDGTKLELAMDSQNRLYWGGELLVTDQRFTLEGRVNRAVIVGAGSTVVLAGMAVLEFLCG